MDVSMSLLCKMIRHIWSLCSDSTGYFYITQLPLLDMFFFLLKDSKTLHAHFSLNEIVNYQDCCMVCVCDGYFIYHIKQ